MSIKLSAVNFQKQLRVSIFVRLVVITLNLFTYLVE